MATTLITVIHIITCVLITIVVLLQSGKGAEISASFGGSSQTVFGSSGGANFFTRLTLTLAGIFMCTSLALTWMGNKGRKSVFDGVTAPISTGATVPPPGKPADAADVRGQESPAKTEAPAAAAGAAPATAPKP